MNIKKLFIPLIVSLVTGCYHNPFLADTYKPIPPDSALPIKEEALYNTSYFLQSKDLKSYDLKEEIPGKNIVGTEVTADIKTYTGFTFDDTHKDNITNGIITEDGNLKLKLYYNRNKYTVTFDKNNESATGEMEPQTFYYDVSASLPSNTFAYIGHVFTGWAKKADATEADFTDSNSVSNLVTENNGNITLYAVWVEGEPVNYTVEHYLQTKDLSSYEKLEKDSNTLQNIAGKEVTVKSESIDGFTFDEEHPENITSGIVAEDGSLILKLYYTRNSYTVTFDKNNKTAVGEMEPQIFYYEVDETQKLNKNQFTDEYHDFLGWAKTADATKDIIKDAAELDFDITKSSDELSLYAVWDAADPAVIKELAVKIPDSDKDLENKAVISTSRNISVTFSSENAIKIYYSLGEESKEIKEESLDFADLTDGDYTLKVWAENIDGVKSEEKTFSWTIACLPKLRIKGTPAPIIEIDPPINIDVSGDNLESCFYSLDDGDSTTDIPLTDGVGSFYIDSGTTGDFTLTVTGKNILNETTDKTFNWKVVKAPKAVLSGVVDFMEADSTQDITVSGCDYYMYKIGDEDWSKVFQVSQPISIKNTAHDTNSYNIYVIGGHTQTYSDENFIWQSKDKPSKTSWNIYPVYSGESLDSVLEDKNKVSGSSGVDGKNIYASYDDNFVYFGYESQIEEDFTQGKKALCIAMWSNGAGNTDRNEIRPVDYIDETEDSSQPIFSLNGQKLTHFLKVTFDTKTTGTTKFFRVSGGNWVETASTGIHVEINKDGKCVLAAPRVLLASPDSEVKYVVYMRNYT
ncbi:MAG: InlB B-repeat-containing protein, partial [Spirochaetota bacterium]|nr:InlB B-repeat-containing protein [Spirochaetota bacterium]